MVTGEEDPSLAYLKLIEKDIPRTLPTHKQARQFGESGSLRRVLKAYCRHHPDVGYCQGMNFVAGLFLIILTNTRTLSGVGGKQAAGEKTGKVSHIYPHVELEIDKTKAGHQFLVAKWLRMVAVTVLCLVQLHCYGR